MKKIILILCLSGGIVAIPYYIGYFDKPETKVQEFADAHNDQNVEGMLDVVDNPEVNQIKRTVKITGKISEALVGVDAAELLLDAFPLMKEFVDMEGIPHMSMDVQEVETNLSRNEAQVYGNLIYEAGDAKEEAFVVFYLHKKDRSWFISDFEETDK